MNTPALILVPSEDDMVNIEHGIELEKKLKDIDITCKGMYVGLVEKDLLTIEGLSLQLFAPSKQVVDKFTADWTAEDLYKKY